MSLEVDEIPVVLVLVPVMLVLPALPDIPLFPFTPKLPELPLTEPPLVNELEDPPARATTIPKLTIF